MHPLQELWELIEGKPCEHKNYHSEREEILPGLYLLKGHCKDCGKPMDPFQRLAKLVENQGKSA